MLLDLATAITKGSNVLSFIETIISKECQREIAQGEDGKIYDDQFASYFDDYDCLRNGCSSLADYEKDVDQRFNSSFEHIRGYHSTRVIDEKSYKEHGIVKLDRKHFEKISNDFLADTIPDGDLNRSIQELEIPEHRKYVYFLWHRNSATVPGNDSYLKAGPEVLNLHDFATDSSRNVGQPCVIHCDVPTTIITPSMRMCIWKYLLASSIEFNSGAYTLKDTLGAAFSTEESVPPNSIVKFEYIEMP